MKKTVIFFVAIAIVYYVISPFFTLQQMKAAAVHRDADALSECIDFESLRQNIKDQLNASISKEMLKQQEDDNPFAAFGTALGSMIIQSAVENFVTPSAIILMMEGSTPSLDSDSDEELQTQTDLQALNNVSFAYKSLNKFVVTLKETDLKFTMKRRGLFAWKLTGITIPMDS